ncbi:MAG TPA: NAD(P)H-hydrate epimerase, partial [Burkholderiales bacterium]|nr:NAD(P)H-hydrate epimerase [Burkholderiales bacterium]
MAGAVYLSAEIRRIEQSAEKLSLPLMARAGAAAAQLAARLVPDARKDVLVLAGPGKYGGDARLVAERLKEQFFRVTLASSPGEVPMDKSWGLVVDGLFGIGLSRELAGDHATLVHYANRQRCP